MKKVAIAGAAIAVLAVALYFTLEHRRLAEMEDTLASFVATSAFTDVRGRCQTDPTRLGPIAGASPDAPAFEVFAYDGEFHPAEPTSPAFSLDLADSMRGKLSAFHTYHDEGGAGVEMGIATPWRSGNCALILVRLARKR